MTNHKEVGSTGSRRSLLKGSAALVAGGVLGGAMTAYKAMSPLCHTSVTKWTLAAGVKVNSKQKKERCAKVAGEVAYTTALAINEYFDRKLTPPVWKPSKEIEHCIECHGPDDADRSATMMNQQQGHMECLMCHDDHNK